MSNASRSGSLCVLGLLALVAVPACSGGHGRGTASGKGSRAGAAICTARSFAGLSVERTDIPMNHITYTFPAHVESSESAKIAALAGSACALPTFPSGVRSCPADLGIAYSLTFTSGAKTVETIVATATGCRSVTGLGARRQAKPIFWRDLALALRLPVPRLSCDPFRGQATTASADCGPEL